MILDAYGRPVRKQSTFETPEWLKREAAAELGRRIGFAAEHLAELRVQDLRETVAAERSTPAAEERETGIAIRLVKDWTIEKDVRR